MPSTGTYRSPSLSGQKISYAKKTGPEDGHGKIHHRLGPGVN